MKRRNIPKGIRPLFQVEEKPIAPPDKPEISDRPEEAKRVVKRISVIIDEHREACQPLNVRLDTQEIHTVIDALKDHAQGGHGKLNLNGYDEIQSHCLQRLFEELVEEPSNILYTTSTGPDSVRYDAMESSFWIECLNLLKNLTHSKKQLHE